MVVSGGSGGLGAAVTRTLLADGRWRSLLVINVGSPAPDSYRERLPRLGFEDVARVV